VVAPPAAPAEADEEPFARLPGELSVLRAAVVALQEGWAAGLDLEDEAELVVTSFRVAFLFTRGARGELHVPHHSVARIEKLGANVAEVESKHCFVFRVRFKVPAHRRVWISAWEDAVQVCKAASNFERLDTHSIRARRLQCG
jgi:hypothetical protein